MKRFKKLLPVIVLVAMLIALFVPAPVAAQGNDLYVDASTGDNANDGSSWPNAKKTITAALALVNGGDTVHVGYGTYQENVTIAATGVTILGYYPAGGDSPGTTQATIQPPPANTDTVLTVTADNVTIRGFTVTGATGAAKAGIWLNDASNCQIRDSTITGNYYGILVGQAAATGNYIMKSDITANYYGLYFWYSGQGNHAEYCNIVGNTQYGARNSGSSDWIGVEKCWWGDASGPDGPRLDDEGHPTGILPGKGDTVSKRVWAIPWLTTDRDTVEEDAIAHFGISTYANKGWNIISTPIALNGYVLEDNTGSNHAANTWGGLWDLGERESIYQGAHTGGDNSAILIDNTRNWTPDELIGLNIANDSDGSYGTITDNDATTVTATLSGGTENDWDGGDNYIIADGHALRLHYTVVEGVGRQYTPVYSYDSQNNIWVQATASTVLNPVDAYFVRMKEADSIPILFSPDKSVPSKYLYQGWNLVGYSYMPRGGPGRQGVSSTLEIALKTIERVSSVSGDVKGYSQVVSPPMNQTPWIYIPPAQGGAGGTFIAPEFAGEQGKEAEECVMRVGRGYWVFMQNPGTLAGLTFTPMSFRMRD